MSYMKSVLPGKMKMLVRYAQKITGDANEAEEIAAETMLKALEKHYLYKKGTNINAWLWTMMKNIVRDRWRRSNRVPTCSLDKLHDGSVPTYEEYDKWLSDEMLYALRSLPRRQLSVLIHVVIGGLSYRETAEKLCIPIGTVMSRLQRAKSKMRERLKNVEKELQTNH